VLARKYRPKTFDELYGQEVVVRTLRNAFQTNRVSQSYMFTGIRGVGKTTVARILARALNYEVEGEVDKPSFDMPKIGTHCQNIIDGRHVDVLEMDAASHSGIQDVRELTDAARYKPMLARVKVYIIDEVHMLSNAAFNGLLKTLEEPHDHVRFILATTEHRKVPVTVLSRCQNFHLHRIAVSELLRLLEKVCDAECFVADREALRHIAIAAEGSARDALSMLEQAVVLGNGACREKAVLDMLGKSSRLVIVNILQDVMKGDAEAALTRIAGQFRAGVDPLVLLSDLAGFVHFITKAKVIGEKFMNDQVGEFEAATGLDLASKLSMPVLSRAWQILLRGMEELRSSTRTQAAADMVIIRLCYSSSLPSPDEVLKLMSNSPDGVSKLISHEKACASFEAMTSSGSGGQVVGTVSGTSLQSEGGSPKDRLEARNSKAPSEGGSPKDRLEARSSKAPSEGGSPKDRLEARNSKAPSEGESPKDRLEARNSKAPSEGESPKDRLEARSSKAPSEGESPKDRLEARNSKAPSGGGSPKDRLDTRHPKNLRDVVDLAAEKLDLPAKMALERQIRPVSFQPGKIEVSLTEDAPYSLPAVLSKKLSDWTGTKWQVLLSEEVGTSTIAEQRIEERKNLENDVKEDPMVAEVLKCFQNAELIDVRSTHNPEDER